MKKLSLTLIAGELLVSLFLLQSLPDTVPMHWNIRGQVDGTMAKIPGVFVLPLMSLAMLGLFRLLPAIDPKKEKYRLFTREWEIIQFGFVAFFAWLQFIILYISLHPGVSMLPLMFIGLGAFFTLLGNFLSKIRQNFFIGIKTPWTLTSEDNWNKTHRYASWCFVLAGIAAIAESYFIWYAPAVIFGSIMLAAVLPVIYSFLLFKKAAAKMKYVYLALAAAVAVIVMLRIASPEDTWLCVGGRWVRHGHPAASVPATPCR